MKKIFTIWFCTIAYTSLFAQSNIDLINSLPITGTVRAPDFDIVREYFASIDTIRNTLYLNDYRFHPENETPHFHQLMYEIPIANIYAKGISVEQSFEDSKTVLYIKMKSNKNFPTFACYWFYEDELVCAQLQGSLVLGPWDYTTANFEELQNIVSKLKSQFHNSEVKDDDKPKSAGMIFKYGSERAKMMGNKDLDGKLHDEFYLADALINKPTYKNKKSFNTTIQQINKEITKSIDPPKKYKFIHVLNIDENGEVISYQSLSNYQEIKKTTLNFERFKPAEIAGENVKSKIVFRE
ncbi:hypothetical protein [Portibacter marinus]|uniref:hypothetical protein n=1 Tax=Portibacter marinus TaxID=2898660 RepID=UPI001F1BF7B8|nr:hypothetical protein [Portibacter marinus]